MQEQQAEQAALAAEAEAEEEGTVLQEEPEGQALQAEERHAHRMVLQSLSPEQELEQREHQAETAQQARELIPGQSELEEAQEEAQEEWHQPMTEQAEAEEQDICLDSAGK